MNLVNKLIRGLSLFEDLRFIKAALTWPKFSLTSFLMVSRLTRQGIKPRTVIDVGGNVGQFAVASARLFPGARIYSFEPVPECVSALKKIEGREKNITLFPVAIGEKEGTVEMNVNTHTHSSSVLPLANAHKEAFPEARVERTVSVTLSTLDKELSDIELLAPVLLKIDVQGFEPMVIKGAAKTLKNVDYVLLEASFKPMYEGELTFDEIVAIMDRCGFDFSRPIDWLSSLDTGEVLQMDALFVRRDALAR